MSSRPPEVALALRWAALGTVLCRVVETLQLLKDGVFGEKASE